MRCLQSFPRSILLLASALVLPLLVTAPSWAASIEAPPPHLEQYFPVSEGLEPAVEFWKNIYARYHSRQVVLHDPVYLEVVYIGLDLSDVFDNADSVVTAQAVASASIEGERERIAKVLRGLALQLKVGKGVKFSKLTKEQRRFYDAFRQTAAWDPLNPEANADLLTEAAGRIRAQRGLRDEFLRGIWDSAPYMPHMEKAFVDRGLPRELTRLTFVESMFNIRARSHVGAAGPFQFMSYTGRNYMRIDTVVDERYDPLIAAASAARLLEDNYRSLGEWPLAITAYNHGVTGMRRAVAQMGTTDLGVIAHNYTSRSFGFASRNFYAEYVAALTVYEYRDQLFAGHPEIQPRPVLLWDQVVLPDYVTADALFEHTELTKEDFERYNPAFTRYVYNGQKFVEKGYAIRLPRGTGQKFAKAYRDIPREQRFAKQRSNDIYIVRHGDTLSQIARRHGVSMSSLMAWNGLHSRHRIAIGQKLRIVPAASGGSKPSTHDKPAVRVVDVVRLPGDEPEIKTMAAVRLEGDEPQDALAAVLAGEPSQTDPMAGESVDEDEAPAAPAQSATIAGAADAVDEVLVSEPVMPVHRPHVGPGLIPFRLGRPKPTAPRPYL